MSISLPVATHLKTQQILSDPVLRKIMDSLGTGQALIVGGAVRAAILGEAQGDIDIATTLTPQQVTQKLEAAGLKIVPTGIDHGTVTAVAEKRGFEITTLRRDVATDGRRAVVAFTTDWSEDAQRRDFTMNTLLMAVDGSVYDPTGQGLDDLKNGIVRFVGDPKTRIAEDALRILRFFRFHARYGKGNPDGNALQACVHSIHLIENLSRERITWEIEKLLPAPRAGASLSLMIASKILGDLWQPRFDQGRYDFLRELVTDAQIPQSEMILLAYSVYENNLQILDGKIRKYFVFSKRKTEFLNDCIRFISEHTDDIQKNIYLFGRDITLAGSILLNILNLKSNTLTSLKALVEDIRKASVPVFPVAARDLMKVLALPEGRALGEALKKVELWWLEKNTAPDRDACLAYAQSLK